MLMLQSATWIFVLGFFPPLSLLTQAGQTFSSYLAGPRTGAEVSHTQRIAHARETKAGLLHLTEETVASPPRALSHVHVTPIPPCCQAHHIHRLPVKPHSGRERAAHCPFSSSSTLLNYK